MQASGHVGCCCGVNPIVTPSVIIDGEIASAVAEAGGRVSAARILQDVDSDFINVCAQSSQLSESSIEKAHARLAELGQSELFNQAERELRSKYPSYSSQCEGGRRLEGVMKSKVTSNATSKVTSKVGSKVFEAEKVESTPRRAQSNLLQCTPPVASNGLKVAFSHTLETDVCSLQTPPVTQVTMQDQCAKFCQPRAVSMLIGSTEYGFHAADSNDICLPPNGVLSHDPTLLANCGQWSQGFQEIEVAAQRLIEQLEVAGLNLVEMCCRTSTLPIHAICKSFSGLDRRLLTSKVKLEPQYQLLPVGTAQGGGGSFRIGHL